jgi:hypothetical protein
MRCIWVTGFKWLFVIRFYGNLWCFGLCLGVVLLALILFSARCIAFGAQQLSVVVFDGKF